MGDVLRQKIADALAVAPPPLTRRDVRLPAVRGKASRPWRKSARFSLARQAQWIATPPRENPKQISAIFLPLKRHKPAKND